jgi:1-acyl-sn-glycerol-3-phosphate acyltransferase
VIVSNHESHLDSFVIWLVFLHRSMRWVAKKELFYFPLFGWALWASGNVAVSRGDTSSDVAKLASSKARARDRDVVFFPEGTRTRDGNFAPFKKGAFAFALNNERPIVPIAIGGTREILPSHELLPKAGKIVVVVGAPIPVDGLRYEDREALRDRCREAVAELRDEALRSAGSPRAT